MESYEKALYYCAYHPKAVIRLSNLLMDIYEGKMSVYPPIINELSIHMNDQSNPSKTPSSDDALPIQQEIPIRITQSRRNIDPTPKELDKVTCRDRAYLLLSTLTKTGESGWDNSEAWFELARVYELMGQDDKAKESLWWVVELEDTKPLRDWNVTI